MRKILIPLMPLALGLLMTASAQTVTPAMKGSSDVAVIVNPKNTATSLTTSELAELLLGEKRFWGSKAPVRVILREPGSHEFDVLVTKIVKMPPAEYLASWKNKVFRGEAASEPTYVPSSGMAVQFGRDVPGALVLLAAHDLPADAKVLKINGKLPGEEGYPLR